MEPPAASAGQSPLFVKVDEAARLRGISRSLAYELANRWIESGCVEGIPAIRLGRRLLVDRAALERLANSGQVCAFQAQQQVHASCRQVGAHQARLAVPHPVE